MLADLPIQLAVPVTPSLLQSPVMTTVLLPRDAPSLKAFGAERGHALASRFAFHHTPKHASWLNAAEIEASIGNALVAAASRPSRSSGVASAAERSCGSSSPQDRLEVHRP